MYIEEITRKSNGKTYKTVLVRESYREGKKVLHRTISNISKLPQQCIEQIKNTLKADKSIPNVSLSDFKVWNSKEFGASKVILSLARELGLDQMIYSRKEQWRENALAMIAGRMVYPVSKLALTNQYLDTVLWELCGHKKGLKPDVDKDCYLSMDKLLQRQDAVQKQLAQKHLEEGCIVLYDITSSYFEGEYEDSELVKYGYNRDRKKGHEQVNIGLLTNIEGCPIAVETFAGNTQDQNTVKGQVKKLVDEYKVKDVIFVGDRGMLTPKRIKEVNDNGFKTITALTRLQMQDLIARNRIQISLFEANKYPEVKDTDNANIRYILCFNPKRKVMDFSTRVELIKATKRQLDKIKKSDLQEKIGARVGKIWAKYGTEKYFQWSVVNGKLNYELCQKIVDEEKKLDGCYVIRSDVAEQALTSKEIYHAYKKLIYVEQAFRIIKTTALEIRPMFHHLDDRIRAHIFICMLAYYLQWHMQQRLHDVYHNDGEGKIRRWSFRQVIERLKSIRSQTIRIGDTDLTDVISTPDEEQKMLLEALCVGL